MAGSQIERVFSVLESLTSDPRGLQMQAIAEQLNIPKSATHRLLAELIRLGYVRQNPENLRYHLSTKLVAMGFVIWRAAAPISCSPGSFAIS